MNYDTISRADVIKIIKSVLSPASSLINVARARRQMLDRINELESKPEPHWIPVKEKNPIEYDNPIEFLVTLEDPSGERYIELLMWDGYEWDEIYTDDNELGIWGQDEVIAWCKPLEPYNEVTK